MQCRCCHLVAISGCANIRANREKKHVLQSTSGKINTMYTYKYTNNDKYISDTLGCLNPEEVNINEFLIPPPKMNKYSTH